jgi:hypothetical protein
MRPLTRKTALKEDTPGKCPLGHLIPSSKIIVSAGSHVAGGI